MNGAQALIQTLVNGNVDVCFMNPGTSEMHFVAALDDVPEMRPILGLFEGVVTGAADGYARMTGKPAATLLHLGPGLANGFAMLHNARRSFSPMINIIGDHASWHLKYDAPLTSDIVSVANPVSKWVKSSVSANAIGPDTAEAIQAALGNPNGIATLILPGDTAWDESTVGPVLTIPQPAAPTFQSDAVEQVVKVLMSGEPTVLVLGNRAIRADVSLVANRIAHATGATVMAGRPTGRLERGAGLPNIQRIPYPIPQAVQKLEAFKHIVLVDAHPPVGFFGYPNLPSELWQPGTQIHRLTEHGEDSAGALAAICDLLNIGDDPGPLAELNRPGLPTGELDIPKVWQAIAALIPENTILSDESLTSGWSSEKFMAVAPPHDVLTGTGGAIGGGLPYAVGAAVACPDRQVINPQADGSAMYSIQALWTMARENLDVVSIIWNNRAYRILEGELEKVGASADTPKAQSMLNLDNPELNFATMAQGMGVEGTRVTSAEDFCKTLEGAIGKSGPHLIEVMI
ncbi:MAG: acetolactate synthase-1/2/3 large subunit [Cellvibrionaceae bacterium]|jgi:acetolactate synthase-1/2/3 large subunit